MIAKCYKPARDSFTGSIKGDGNYVGDVDIVLGGPAPQPVARFPGVVNTEGMVGIRRGPIDVDQGDRLVVGNTVYSVTGPRQWDFPNELTGTMPDYYWCEVTASHRPKENHE